MQGISLSAMTSGIKLSEPGCFGTRPWCKVHLQSVGCTGIGCLLTREDALQGPVKRLCAIQPRTVSAFMQGAESRLHMPRHVVLVQHGEGLYTGPCAGVRRSGDHHRGASGKCQGALHHEPPGKGWRVPDADPAPSGRPCTGSRQQVWHHPSHMNRYAERLAVILEWQVSCVKSAAQRTAS